MERKKRSKGSVWELCYFRDVWIRNKSVRAEIGQILHTDTHPHNRGYISSKDIEVLVILASWLCVEKWAQKLHQFMLFKLVTVMAFEGLSTVLKCQLLSVHNTCNNYLTTV